MPKLPHPPAFEDPIPVIIYGDSTINIGGKSSKEKDCLK